MFINPKFKLKNSKPENKPTIIRLEVYYNKKTFVYYTGEKIEPEYWDKKNYRVKQVKKDRERNEKHKDINYILNDFENKIKDIFNEYSKKGEIPSKENLKNDLNEIFKKENEPEQKEYTLNSYIDKFIKEIETGERQYLKKRSGKNFYEQYKPSTIKVYKEFRNQLTTYQNKRNIKLQFSDINMKFYKDYIKFFEDKNYKPNSIGKQVKSLKTILRASHKENLHNNNIYLDTDNFVTFTNNDVKNIYLSFQELEKMYNLDLSKTPNLELSRDIFLIGSFTALRFSDYSRIRPSNIINIGGSKSIEMYTKKTGERVVIPFWHWILEELLIKYKYTIPKTHEQRLNKEIKEVGKLAEINEMVQIEEIRGGFTVKRTVEKYKLIMSHTGRRSAATNMYKNDIPIIDIMKITGHLTESSFMLYIKTTKEETAERIMKNHRVTKPLKIAN